MPAVAKPIQSPEQLVIPITIPIMRLSERKSRLVIDDGNAYKNHNSRAYSYCGSCIVAIAARLAYPNLTLIVNNKHCITQYANNRITDSPAIARYHITEQSAQHIIETFDLLTLECDQTSKQHAKALQTLHNLLPFTMTAELVAIYED